MIFGEDESRVGGGALATGVQVGRKQIAHGLDLCARRACADVELIAGAIHQHEVCGAALAVPQLPWHCAVPQRLWRAEGQRATKRVQTAAGNSKSSRNETWATACHAQM